MTLVNENNNPYTEYKFYSRWSKFYVRYKTLSTLFKKTYQNFFSNNVFNCSQCEQFKIYCSQCAHLYMLKIT